MNKEYKIYDLKCQYESFVGSNPIAVVSDLSLEELLSTYPELKVKMPFVLQKYSGSKYFLKFRGSIKTRTSIESVVNDTAMRLAIVTMKLYCLLKHQSIACGR